jgi:hypothetical protein
MTQEQRVIDMLSDGGWHCQKEFWDRYMRSPHKRREGAEKLARRKIEARKCEHGMGRSFDYRFEPKEPTLF